MKIVKTLLELRSARATFTGSLGLVPTMGYLHRGHLSLVQSARAENEFVAASIFVNPAQFESVDDLDDYPRDLERDLDLLDTHNVDLVWAPDRSEMYPHGYQTYVTVNQLTSGLEGGRRPGHMRGVTTIVSKLLIAFRPDRAYFGQKDAQQVCVVRRLVADLGFPVEVVTCPTVRESDGLALSSRNARLSVDQRQASTVLFRALSAASVAFAEGQRDGDKLCGLMSDVVATEPLADARYIAITEVETLQDLRQLPEQVLASLAVCIGQVVLIDNMVLGET
ncbi:MAG: pantoate--beta-alanine ligase [Anaerolineales bacterium]|nr:pantoate--beta-alanine ligase [Anaerolineales bacterium]